MIRTILGMLVGPCMYFTHSWWSVAVFVLTIVAMQIIEWEVKAERAEFLRSCTITSRPPN